MQGRGTSGRVHPARASPPAPPPACSLLGRQARRRVCLFCVHQAAGAHPPGPWPGASRAHSPQKAPPHAPLPRSSRVAYAGICHWPPPAPFNPTPTPFPPLHPIHPHSHSTSPPTPQPPPPHTQVYVSDRNIDDQLVRSISLPAQDPNAAEVFYRIITGGWVAGWLGAFGGRLRGHFKLLVGRGWVVGWGFCAATCARLCCCCRANPRSICPSCPVLPLGWAAVLSECAAAGQCCWAAMLRCCRAGLLCVYWPPACSPGCFVGPCMRLPVLQPHAGTQQVLCPRSHWLFPLRVQPGERR